MRKARLPPKQTETLSLKKEVWLMKRKNQSGKPQTAKQQTTTAVNQSNQLRRAIDWIVRDDIFADVKLHGNVGWSPKSLVVLAVLLCWVPSRQLVDGFQQAVTRSRGLFETVAVQTFQGLMRALVTYGPQFLDRLWARIHTLAADVSPTHYRIGKWVPLAVDGSRFSTPNTISNELAFSAKHFGKGEKARSRSKWKNRKRRSKKLASTVTPQIWLTLIWHMGLKLPWCWKLGPSTSSERHHFKDMLSSRKFPNNTLFCGDAGFTGYEFWSAIQQASAHFLIRVGANVRLLKKLGKFKTADDTVFLWPDDVAQGHGPPLMLRLIEVKNSRGSMFLITNVMNRCDLSNARLTQLYSLRWGIELQFRAVKQTFGRRKLRCRSAEHATVELEWSLMSLTMIQLLAIREQTKIDIPPEVTSVALAIAAMQHAMDTWNDSVPASCSVNAKLKTSIRDNYTRKKSKTSRYPQKKNKDKPAATKPQILTATRTQQKLYVQYLAAA